MKNINTYITERLKISKDSAREYKYHPKDKDELQELLKKLIDERGKDADLNDIDVSKITDMELLFQRFYPKIENINISYWDVSNVVNMKGMFWECENFSCDLSKWNVSKVTEMDSMFSRCKKFNSDLSKWDVSKAKHMDSMFYNCKEFESDLSKWDVANCESMVCMFSGCTKFKSDLSDWEVNITEINKLSWIFDDCDSFGDYPEWYNKIYNS